LRREERKRGDEYGGYEIFENNTNLMMNGRGN